MQRGVVALALLGLSACYSTSDVTLLEGPTAPLVIPTAPSSGLVGDGGAQAPGAATPDGGASIAVISRPLTYYADVKPIVDAKCTQCHVQGGMGHFPLTKYEELKPLAPVIRGAVHSGKMPPWRATGPLDKYVGDRRLSNEQKSVIISWIDQGAPAGDPATAAPPQPVERRGLPRVDSTIPLPEPFTPPPDADTYRCFVLDWPQTATKYITGLSIEPGNRELVHHAIVYLVAPQNVAAIKRRDEAAPGVGFDCLDGAGLNSQWLTSYEPGGYGQENPGGVGFEVAPGSALVLQMHYNTMSAKGTDASSVQLMLADKVDRVGTVQLIMNPLWVAGAMPIPANQPDVVHQWTGRPLGVARNQAYDLYWADLHAHTLASQMYMGIIRAGQTTREPLLEIPDWSFAWQETFRFQKSVRLEPNDQLYVECHFNNTADRQPVINGKPVAVRNVNWGENTTDEMCLGNVLAVPAR